MFMLVKNVDVGGQVTGIVYGDNICAFTWQGAMRCESTCVDVAWVAAMRSAVRPHVDVV